MVFRFENRSSLIIDSLEIALQDDLSVQQEQIVSTEDLTAAQLYDLEIAMHSHPPLCVQSTTGDEGTVPAYGQYSLSVECFGRIGM